VSQPFNATENLGPRRRSERKIVDWSEPPKGSRVGTAHGVYARIARELREHPGHWAQLEDRSSASGAYQFALRVRLGHPAAFRPAGAYEGRSSGTSVWVRYVGEPELVEPEPEPVDLTPRPDPTHAFNL
jgi:hypothetical protein